MPEPLWVTLSRCASEAESTAKTWDDLEEAELADAARRTARAYTWESDVARGLDPAFAERCRKTGNCVKCGAVASWWRHLGYDPSLCTRCGQLEHQEGEDLPPGAPESYEQFKRRFLASERKAMRSLPDTWQKWAKDERRREIRQTIADFKTGLHSDDRSCYCKQCWASHKLWEFWGPDSWHSRQGLDV